MKSVAGKAAVYAFAILAGMRGALTGGDFITMGVMLLMFAMMVPGYRGRRRVRS